YQRGAENRHRHLLAVLQRGIPLAGRFECLECLFACFPNLFVHDQPCPTRIRAVTPLASLRAVPISALRPADCIFSRRLSSTEKSFAVMTTSNVFSRSSNCTRR